MCIFWRRGTGECPTPCANVSVSAAIPNAAASVGMDGHPSAQAKALVTLGNSGRFLRDSSRNPSLIGIWRCETNGEIGFISLVRTSMRARQAVCAS